MKLLESILKRGCKQAGTYFLFTWLKQLTGQRLWNTDANIWYFYVWKSLKRWQDLHTQRVWATELQKDKVRKDVLYRGGPHLKRKEMRQIHRISVNVNCKCWFCLYLFIRYFWAMKFKHKCLIMFIFKRFPKFHNPCFLVERFISGATSSLQIILFVRLSAFPFVVRSQLAESLSLRGALVFSSICLWRPLFFTSKI